ncbi:MAG: sulfotransferase [Trueperaceae bacterium]|nr:sulfotransferase [Trueperaceae bacterium]
MKPNFFIVGAPKCGTTALAQYLSEHPQVFMADPKEPHFFADDLPGHHKAINQKDYLRLFSHAREQKIVGEASVWYLYSDSALKNIKCFNPQAKLLVMLRNPVELVYSMHSQHLYTRNEHEQDFAEAWFLSEKRRQGKAIISTAQDGHKVLQYDEIARLGEQLERLLKLFPRQQVMWIFFDDFKTKPVETYKQVMQFLAIEDLNRKSFPRINSNKRQKYPWLANFTERPPQWLVWPLQELKRRFNIQQRFNLLKPLRQINDVVENRPALSPEMTQIILQHYRDDILKLAQLTGRNLDHWLYDLEPQEKELIC